MRSILGGGGRRHHVYAGIGTNAHSSPIRQEDRREARLLPAELADRRLGVEMSSSDTHVAGGVLSLAELVVSRRQTRHYKIVKATARRARSTWSRC
ncbi:hypothetical protein [Nonomuraea dietziae]|uniref:hypothetical protein n=1 Tax=Nonomuraea dietziae TaxID=65515 RepID=UPI0031E1FB0E